MATVLHSPSACPMGCGARAAAALPVPRFEPPRFVPPSDWPSTWRWLGAARRNALELFPQRCFEEPHVAHRVLGRDLVVLSDPASIAEVTGSASAGFGLTNMHLRMLGPSLGDGVIVAEGAAWRRHRRASIKVAAPAREARPSGAAAARIAALVAAWRDHDAPVAIQPALALLAIDLLTSELFEHDAAVGDARVLAAIDRHRRTVEAADWLDVAGAPPWLGTPRLRRARRIVRDFDRDIHAAIAARGGLPVPAAFSDREARDLVVNLMSGFESIATTATWLLALIGMEAPLRRWLTDPAADEATRAARMDAAIRETLRLYPPLPMIYRRALDRHDLAAGPISRGATVAISPYVVHRHATLWSGADTFDPGRWAAGAAYPGYLPFGVGARQCVGKHLGPRLIAQIVRAVLAGLRPRLCGPLPPPRAGLSLRPAAPIVLDFGGG